MVGGVLFWGGERGGGTQRGNSGADTVGALDHEEGTMLRHDEESFKRMWGQVGGRMRTT